MDSHTEHASRFLFAMLLFEDAWMLPHGLSAICSQSTKSMRRIVAECGSDDAQHLVRGLWRRSTILSPSHSSLCAASDCIGKQDPTPPSAKLPISHSAVSAVRPRHRLWAIAGSGSRRSKACKDVAFSPSLRDAWHGSIHTDFIGRERARSRHSRAGLFGG